MTEPASTDFETLPPIAKDKSFWGLTITQFLGAFNDNLFKQLVLLLCIDFAIQEAAESENKYQPFALALFALPWVFFSGIAGYVSDKTRKNRGIFWFKVLEIVVMTAGAIAFWSSQLVPLLAVLFLMSVQSTFFGPAKYGILPELFRDRDLPNVNGIFQMTTFLAIIFGMALAGLLKEHYRDAEHGLVMVSAYCIGIAVIGTLTTLVVRPVPTAQPDLKLTVHSFGIDQSNWRLLKEDRGLLGVLLISSIFWFVGGVVQPSVNIYGRQELGLGDGRTSLIACCLGIGIAFGCVVAGRISKKRVRFSLVTAGSFGLAASLGGLVALSYFAANPDVEPNAPKETWMAMITTASALEWFSRLDLIALGFFAGVFIVPLQVVLQVVPPESQKGRMIATMNLVNWLGILMAAGFVGLYDRLRGQLNVAMQWNLRPATVFGVLATMLIAVGVFYRPADRELS